ncbi:MAG: CDP-diacylglycerol--glycerol-3-phosphate 3-phosphatidyltransferase [Phycisphaerales bacterium]|nr:CDP-diacylglycerol--glycerol-3-phosphate 3-phosphatidyltransferase [Phycisphaerales bacterium]
MGEYQPASRRPIAAPFRRTADGAVRLCVRWDVHPDVISYLSMAAAAAAGICFWLSGRWPWLLIVAPLLCFARLWCNMLDGMVALASGKASLRGEIVNELPDRVSDILIFVGVAHSGWVNPFLAYWAAIMALLTAYVGTLGQAVTGRRRFEGMMSKQHRMVVLAVGAWVMFALRQDPPRAASPVGALSAMDWACIVIIVGCVQTVWVRLLKIMRELRGRGEGGTS